MTANRKISKGKPAEHKTSKPTRGKSKDPDLAPLKRATTTSQEAKEDIKLYQALFENMLHGFAYCKVDFENGIVQDFTYIAVNSAYESLTGLKNITGKKVSEVAPGLIESDPAYVEMIGRVASTGKPERFETFAAPLNRWFSISLYCPEKGYFVGLVDNITERKEAEAARDQLASIIGASEDAVLSKTLDGIITSWNKGSEKLYGYSAQEAIGQSISSLIIPPDRPNELPDILERIKRGEPIEHYETVRQRKDGTQVNISISISPMMDSLGNIIGASTIARDITERKQMEEALQKSQERFVSMFHSSPAAMSLSTAGEGRYLEVNDAFLNIFDSTREQVIGHTVLELNTWVDLRQRDALYAALKPYGKVDNFEMALRTRTGKVIELLWSGVQVVVDGKTCLLGSALDITERKQAEQQIAQLNRLYATLSQVNQTIVRARSDGELYQSICNVAVEYGGFALVWIGLLDENTGDVKPVVANGLNVANWPLETVNTKQGPFTVAPIATALRTSRVVTSEELPADQRMQNIHFRYQNHTYLSTAAVPFRLRGKTIGVVSLVSDEAGFFKSGEEIRLLDEMGLDISFALDTIETEGERRRAEEEHHKSEQKFSHAFHKSPAAMTITRITDGTFIDANDEFLNTFEFTRDEVIGHTSIELNMLGPEARRLLIERQLAAGGLQNVELETQSKSGRKITVLFSSSPIDINDEAHHLTTMIDITKRKQAEKKIQQQNQRLLVLREIDMAILAADSIENIVSTALSHIRQMIGCRRADLTLIDRETNEAVVFDVSMNGEAASPKGRRTSLAESQDIIHALSQNQLLLMNDLPGLADPRPAIQRLLKDGLQSLCSLPLFSQGTLIGMFSMFSEVTNYFDDEKINLGREVANQVAIAISQSRLVESLRTSEETYSVIFDRSPFALTLTKMPELTIVSVNNAFVELFELTPAEAIGKTSAELGIADPESRAKIGAEFQVQGMIRDFEVIRHTKAGRRLNLALNLDWVTIGDEKYILTTIRDISERTQAEERFRLALESAPNAIIMVDQSGVIVLVNSMAEKYFGYVREELIGATIDILVPVRFRDHHADHRNGFISEPKARAMGVGRELYGLRKDGIEFPIEIGLAPIEAQQGTLILATIVDITERKQSAQALGESEERLRQVWESTSDAMALSDENGIVLDANPAYLDLYGYSAEQVIGKSFSIIFPEENRKQAIEQYKAVFNDQTTVKLFESDIQREDGSRRIVESSITFFTVANQRTTMLSTIRDITERKLADQALMASEQRYRGLFEDSPISVWEEDFSLVKEYIDMLRKQGVSDFRAYFLTHIEEVMECASRVNITNVNKAALKMYQAESATQMLGSLREVITANTMMSFQEELITIAEGKTSFQWEGTDRTLMGKPIEVNLNWSVSPGHEHDYSKVIVSTIDITERKEAEERTQRQLERLEALRTIDVAISSSSNLKLTLEIVLAQVITLLNTDAAAILLFHPITKTLQYMTRRGFHSATLREGSVGLADGFAGKAILERRTIHISNLQERITTQPRQNQLLRGENFVDYYCAPLIVKGEVKGALEVFHRSALAEDLEWFDFLETLAGQAAIAIENSQLFDGLQRSNIELSMAYDATIEGWSHALDLRDKETEGHSLRVTELTVQLAQAMGVGEMDLVNIRRGALLHDIGKMGVPDNILLKPGKLTDEEWEKMRQHPGFAHEMLADIEYLRPALDIPYCHHEKWDGSGYPRGLGGEQIPLAARIFAVVDVWDALRSDRPYRAGWTEEKTLEYIQSESGKHFDPQVVGAFMKLISGE